MKRYAPANAQRKRIFFVNMKSKFTIWPHKIKNKQLPKGGNQTF